MKRLIILAAAAITAGAVAPAAAADLPARAPATYSKAPAIVEAAYDWSGFYVGINGGGATSNNLSVTVGNSVRLTSGVELGDALG